MHSLKCCVLPTVSSTKYALLYVVQLLITSETDAPADNTVGRCGKESAQEEREDE